MSARQRLASVALVLAAFAAPACLQKADPIAAEQLEIDCRAEPCPWLGDDGKLLPGTENGQTTWESGDIGLDLSGTGTKTAELDVVMLQQTSRALDLRAAIVRPDDPSVTLRFEIQWYAPGSGFGASFWDRQPVFLGTKSYEIWESGASSVARTVLVPSEAAALKFRVLKSSPAQATVMVGDLTLGHPAGSSL